MEHDSQFQHGGQKIGHVRSPFDYTRKNECYPETKNRQTIYGKLPRSETQGKPEEEFNQPFRNKVYGYLWHPKVTVNQHLTDRRDPAHQ